MPLPTFKTDVLSKLRKRITADPDSLYMMVRGDLGSGKSWVSLSLCAGLDPSFIENMEERIIFTPIDFVLTMARRKLPPGSMLMWDEAQTSMNAKRHMSNINLAINTQLDTMRRDNIGLVFNCPNTIDKAIMRNLDFEVETIAIDRGMRKTEVKLKKIEHNKTTDKIYKKYVRIVDEGSVPTVMNPLFIPAPDHPGFLGADGRRLIEYYEGARDEFQDRITKGVLKKVIKSYAKEMNVSAEDLGLDLEDLGVADQKKIKRKEDLKKDQIKKALKLTDLKYREIAELCDTTLGYVKEVGAAFNRK